MRPSPVRLTATVAALLVALGGCGGASTEIGDLPADAVFLTAVDRSTDISTARIAFESTIRQDGEVVHTSQGEGVIAPRALSFTATSTAIMGGSGTEGEAAADRSMEVRFIDGTAYIRMPELMLDMTDRGGPVWVSLRGDDADGMAAQLEQFDLGAALQAVRDTAEVTADGRETVAGVMTTRYAGTTTLRSLLLAQGGTEEQLDEQEQGDGGRPDLDDPMPLTVWIDDEGLVRRLEYTTGDGGFESTQSMTVLEYGLEVEITAPPAQDTMTADEFEAFQDQHADSSGSQFEFEGSATAEGSVTVEARPTDEPAPPTTSDSDS